MSLCCLYSQGNVSNTAYTDNQSLQTHETVLTKHTFTLVKIWLTEFCWIALTINMWQRSEWGSRLQLGSALVLASVEAISMITANADHPSSHLCGGLIDCQNGRWASIGNYGTGVTIVLLWIYCLAILTSIGTAVRVFTHGHTQMAPFL